jgi:hypothetical protein
LVVNPTYLSALQIIIYIYVYIYIDDCLEGSV